MLGGALSPIDGVDPEDLKIAELYTRVEQADGVREVVVATNPTTTGEATALHIADALRERAPDVAVTRLASGLPVGADLEYADEVTLGRRSPGAARSDRCRVRAARLSADDAAAAPRRAGSRPDAPAAYLRRERRLVGLASPGRPASPRDVAQVGAARAARRARRRARRSCARARPGAADARVAASSSRRLERRIAAQHRAGGSRSSAGRASTPSKAT